MKVHFTYIMVMWGCVAVAQRSEVEIEHMRFYETIYLDEVCDRDSNATVVDHEINFNYPHFHSSNLERDSILNQEIDNYVVLYHPYSSEYAIDLNTPVIRDTTSIICMDNVPFKTFLDYQIKLVNEDIISVEFTFLDIACCGGNGSRGETLFVSFDLEQQRELFLKDIALNSKLLIDSLNKQLKRDLEVLDTHSSEMFKIHDLDIPFGLSTDQIEITVRSPYGMGSHSLEFRLILPFKEYENVLMLNVN